MMHGGTAPHFLLKEPCQSPLRKTAFNATVEDVPDENMQEALHQVQND